MSKTYVKLIILLVLMALILGVFLLKIAGQQSQRTNIASTLGNPHVLLNQENNNLNSSITQVVEYKDYIFLVYGYESIVQVYSLEGIYQYALSVYNYSNGRAEIAIDNDVLYLCDKHRNMYAFRGKAFIEFIDKTHSDDLHDMLHFGRNSPHYAIKAGSVWYTNGEHSHCVVKKSAWQVFYQNNLLELLLLFLLILVGIVLRFPFFLKMK